MGGTDFYTDNTVFTSGTTAQTVTINYGGEGVAPAIASYFGAPQTALEWLDRRVNEIRVKL